MVKKETIKITDKQEAFEVVRQIRQMTLDHAEAHEELVRRSQEIMTEFQQRHQELFKALMVALGRSEEEWKAWNVDMSYLEHGLAFLGKSSHHPDNAQPGDGMTELLKGLITGRPN